jgi:hypothetical protein
MAIFDRFIAYAWTERALEMAVKQEPSQSFQNWLIGQGLGKESARRTGNILSRMWFKTASTSEPLLPDALGLFPSLNISEHLVLHWGMGIVHFPVFRETAQVIGRLGLLQGEFTKEEIINRVLMKYSNQSTIQRAIERTIQTMFDWSVIQITPQRKFRQSITNTISSPVLAEWLFRAIMIGLPEKYWILHDLVGAMEAFPFSLKSHTSVLYTSPHMEIVRDSNGAEIVGIRENLVKSA